MKDITVGEMQELMAMFRGDVRSEKHQRTFAKGRYILVIDRGWILAGDASMTEDGYVRLDNAVHVFSWKSIGFTRMITEWRTDNVDVRKSDLPFETDAESIIFRIPVPSGWGLK